MTPRPPTSTLFPYTTLFRSNLQLRLHGGAERAARDAVAAGQERGPADDEVGPRRGHQGDHLRHRAIRLLGGVIVAADHRRHDRTRVAERLLDGARGAHGAVDHLRPNARLLLAAELAKELVEVADHAQGFGRHHGTSAITRSPLVVVSVCNSYSTTPGRNTPPRGTSHRRNSP